jgi:predicted Zn-dependent protease with MMP-like domain
MRTTREEERARFDRLVQEAWLAIPAGFRRRVENVAIVVEEEPSHDDLRRASPGADPRGATLLGLYHGIPLTRRTSSYGMVLPDKISIYRGPLERISRNERELRRNVRETLWHELGHYFGMDERQVRQAARRWRKA